jgi:protein O-GlcNAc transferase
LGVEITGLGSAALDTGLDWLYAVHQGGDALVEVLLRTGGGNLPVPILVPEKAIRLLHVLFRHYDSVLPGLCSWDPNEAHWHAATGVESGLESRKATAAALLTLSCSLQDEGVSHQFYLPAGSGRSMPSSLSLHLILHYLALALYPTPSIYNNIGILMASTHQTATTTTADGSRELINSDSLPRVYFSQGLALDPQHPYLMTNLASTLKDEGRIALAIR